MVRAGSGSAALSGCNRGSGRMLGPSDCAAVERLSALLRREAGASLPSPSASITAAIAADSLMLVAKSRPDLAPKVIAGFAAALCGDPDPDPPQPGAPSESSESAPSSSTEMGGILPPPSIGSGAIGARRLATLLVLDKVVTVGGAAGKLELVSLFCCC